MIGIGGLIEKKAIQTKNQVPGRSSCKRVPAVDSVK